METFIAGNDSHSVVAVASGFVIMTIVIIILRVSRWYRHKAAVREFGAVQVTELTEVVQVNPMQANAVVEAHAVRVPSAAAAIESERPFVSPESPVEPDEKLQPDLGF